MSDGLMTIRQMCDAFEVTPRTLRFYEARELIAPERRGQHRLYDRRDRARLKLILQGKRFGFSLEEIRQLLELYDPRGDNAAQLAATVEVARVRLEQMIRQQHELALAITDLGQQIAEAERLLLAARRAG
ncbi:MAG: MerR family DNA-binding transcriptional regulator [Paracoccus sp. (in: a-proteobacteria)]|nr:MerR family DNA-binding transcriptional regulator [Paracoccus sp. (in: a-proteobacteria)]